MTDQKPPPSTAPPSRKVQAIREAWARRCEAPIPDELPHITDQKPRRREVPIPDKPTHMSTAHYRKMLKEGQIPRQQAMATLSSMGMAWGNSDVLRGLAIVSTFLDDTIRAEVASLREDGLTPWADIGASLGMSKQAAQQRYPDKTD